MAHDALEAALTQYERAAEQADRRIAALEAERAALIAACVAALELLSVEFGPDDWEDAGRIDQLLKVQELAVKQQLQAALRHQSRRHDD